MTIAFLSSDAASVITWKSADGVNTRGKADILITLSSADIVNIKHTDIVIIVITRSSADIVITCTSADIVITTSADIAITLQVLTL